ncbi:tetratricopeptide repeat protein [Lysobacter korlensis]|uniref:Tetratricopeptide repeat protein n=1 Tax=Lysobacter korlensis TaxID=553636 RepID=A0ABV6RSP3_9GAMM
MAGWILAAAAALLLSLPAHARQPDEPPAGTRAEHTVAEAADAPGREQIMAIPPELRAQFEKQVLAAGGNQQQVLTRLVGFLFGKSGLGITYRHDATYTVAEAYRTRTANCLTFTLLTVALARQAGLKAYGQGIEDTLTWHQDQSLVYRTNHVNAGVSVQTRRFAVDVAQDSVIARHPAQPIDDERLLALYYNNRAIELTGSGQRDAAARHMAASLQLDPGYATSWSNAGVLEMRKGDLQAAERHYEQALSLAPTHVATLVNLVALEERRGNAARAAAYRKRLDKEQLKDPFHQFQLALEQEKRGQYDRAVGHYRNAIRLHEGEHRFHSGLARVYLLLGHSRRAEKSLTRAHELSQGSVRDRYLAKLESLRMQPR